MVSARERLVACYNLFSIDFFCDTNMRGPVPALAVHHVTGLMHHGLSCTSR